MADVTRVPASEPSGRRLGAFLDPLPAGRGGRGLLVAVAVVSALWLGGVVLPYYVNDLDSLPLSEVASGRHDPKDLWPASSGAWGALLQGLGVLVMMGVGPTVLLGSAAWATWSSLGRWQRLATRTRLTYLLVIVLGLGTTAAMLSPFGSALYDWSLD